MAKMKRKIIESLVVSFQSVWKREKDLAGHTQNMNSEFPEFVLHYGNSILPASCVTKQFNKEFFITTEDECPQTFTKGKIGTNNYYEVKYCFSFNWLHRLP